VQEAFGRFRSFDQGARGLHPARGQASATARQHCRPAVRQLQPLGRRLKASPQRSEGKACRGEQADASQAHRGLLILRSFAGPAASSIVDRRSGAPRGSTGRWPVGFSSPPKPPTQFPLTIRPRNTRTRRRNPEAAISALFASLRLMNAASPVQCGAARAVGPFTAAPLRRMRIGSTGRWPVGFGGPPKPPTHLRPSPKALNTRTTQKSSSPLISALFASQRFLSPRPSGRKNPVRC